ncbi:MAG: diguanylate cyclase [Rhodocyclaceae bacterium]|nr:diguanylate cyclase [Rhodocyclaceae bacterium]
MATEPRRLAICLRHFLPALAGLLLLLVLGLSLGARAALGALAMALLLWPFLVAARRSLRQLAALTPALEAYAVGETPGKLPVTGAPEAAALTRAFNAMEESVARRFAALKRSESRFSALANGAYGIEAWLNPRGRLVWINPSVERLTGQSVQACILAPDPVELLVYDKDRRHVREALARALQGKISETLDVRLQCKDGSLLWVGLDWQQLPEEEGDAQGVRLSMTLIGTRKQAEMKLLETVTELRRTQTLHDVYLRRSDEERQRLAALLDVMKVGVLLFDTDHRLVRCNQTFLSIMGFPLDENLVGVRDAVILERATPLLADPLRYRHRLDAIKAGVESPSPFEIRLTDGRILTELTVPVPGATPGSIIGRVWLYEDVTNVRQAAERLTQLADRDPLTNLLNRRRFHEDLERMLAESRRRNSPVGLLMLDLDGFKTINDTWGHHAGDEVLTTLATQVGGTVRKNEMFFRLGGDEFAILAPDSGENEMIGLARRVSGIIVDLRWLFGGTENQVTASLGIAVYPRDARDAEELVGHADQAMYQAKSSGRNAWQVYGGSGKW